MVCSWWRLKFWKCQSSYKDLDVYTIFRPFYYVLLFTGVFPFSIKYSKSKHTFSTIPKSIYFNLSVSLSYILLIIIFFVLHVQTLFLESTKSSLTDVIVTKINYVMELLNLIIFCVLAYIYSSTNCFKYISILNRISKICYKDLPVIDPEIYISLIRKVKLMIVQLILITLIHVIINSTRTDGIWKIVLVTFSFVVPQLIQFVVISFLKLMVYMIVIILKNMQSVIKLYVTKSTVYEGILKVDPKVTKPPLRELEQAYLETSTITLDLNKCFDILILVTILQCFHATVSEAHIIYHGVVTEKSFRFHEIINCSVWVSWQILKLYNVASSGQILKVEAKKVVQYLHMIPADKQDLRLLLEIQHFNSMMISQNIEITVCGFFTLDSSLVSTVISSAAMYLAIFIQFDKPL